MQSNMKPRLIVSVVVVFLLVVAALARVATIQSNEKTSARKAVKPTVQSGFKAEGVVQDANGQPIPGVKVCALWETMESPREWLIRDTTVSSKNGRFAFKSLPWLVRGREYVLVAYVPDRFLGQISTRIYSNVGSRNQRSVDSNLVIKLHGLGTYTGRVVDQKDKGLGGVIVQPIEMTSDNQYFDNDRLNAIAKTPKAISDASGYYKLVGVPDGFRLKVKAEKRGYTQYPRPYDAKANHVVMMSSARVRGKLIDQTGKGITGAIIWTDAEGFDGYGRTKTDQNGVYEFDLYPAGRYAISAPEMKELLAKGLRNVRVEIGKTVEAPKMVAMRTVLLRGRVIDSSSGNPVEGFVNLHAMSYFCPLSKSSTLKNHSAYEFNVLPGETYRVEYIGLGLYQNNERMSRTIKVSKRGAGGVDLHLQKVATAVGYVVDQAGRPIDGAYIYLPGHGPQSARGPSYGMAQSDSDGRFEIGISPGLTERASGPVLVYAYHGEKHLAATESVDLQTLLNGKLKLSLKPVSTLTITVLGSGGKPSPGATVYIYPDFPGRGSVETDSNGLAVFDVCPGLNYYLTAKNSYASSRYPKTGETPVVGDKDWDSDITIKLR